jgi:hypothetical protein
MASLITVDLHDAPPYEPVSHVCGPVCDDDLERRQCLIIDGSPIQIRPRLFNAIHTLRSPVSARSIWIDALSSNMRNMEERVSQVRMMTQIYSNAHNVPVYIGKPTAKTEEGM